MSFTDDMKSETAAFLAEFGEAAVFDNTNSITVIFDNPTNPILDIETGGIIMPKPQALAQESDVPNARGKTLKIGNTTYKIKESRPDGSGMTTLTLSKD